MKKLRIGSKYDHFQNQHFTHVLQKKWSWKFLQFSQEPFVKKGLQHWCFSVNIEKFFRTTFLWNTSSGCFCIVLAWDLWYVILVRKLTFNNSFNEIRCITYHYLNTILAPGSTSYLKAALKRWRYLFKIKPNKS